VSWVIHHILQRGSSVLLISISSDYKDCKRYKTCEHCAGKGTTMRMVNRKITSAVKCNFCQGRGNTKYYVLCKKCENKRFVDRTLPVRIPKGVHEGHGLQIKNRGNLMPDEVTRGAVIFRINVLEHDIFQRRGDNLYLTVKISLKEAIMGFKNKTLCTHLDGRVVTATQPCGKVIKPNSQRLVKGEGMPIFGSKTGAHGNLLVTFQVEFPDTVQVPDSKIAKATIDQLFETEQERKAKANAIVIEDEDEDELESEYLDSDEDVQVNHTQQTDGKLPFTEQVQPNTNSILEEVPLSHMSSESETGADSRHSESGEYFTDNDGDYQHDNIFSRGFPSFFSHFF
jgi:DnaJ-class molecular chaperone